MLARNPIDLATELTIAWLGTPHTRASVGKVPAFLQAMHDAVAKLTTPAAPVPEQPATTKFTPAVIARMSLASPEHIISMIDGKPYRTLRRHLASSGLTPDDYRQRYGLRADYPMVAPAYSESRSALALAASIPLTPLLRRRLPTAKLVGTPNDLGARPVRILSRPFPHR